MDCEWAAVAEFSSENPNIAISPDQLSYVIYTSGSTGVPKGVMIPHKALVNHGLAITRAYELASTDKVLQFAALSFDVAAEEIYPTWLAGATLVLRPEDMLTSFATFERFVAEQEVTVLNLPAAFWQEWVSELERTPNLSVPDSVRLVVTGSEKVSGAKLKQWQTLVPQHVRWLNAYGPTEATITSTIFDPMVATGEVDTAVPIGRPIDNTQVYLLDAQLQPVPIGVSGELYLGGVGLARGYLHQPQLTAQSFVPNPLADVADDSLYKTGDLARYLADGNIEFLGRTDHQVKVRGFRIELGEIETALNAQASVAACVVDVRDDGQGNGRLVGYIIAADASFDREQVRAALNARLPDYMVPTEYVLLDTFPLAPSGKIDRRALPMPDFSVAKTNEVVPARTELEAQLVQIWEELLKVSPIGITDNYFELGGQSLLAMRLVARIKEETGQKLPLATLFAAPTIVALARALTAGMDGETADLQVETDYKPWVIPIQPEGTKRPFFHMGGSALLYNLARYLGDDQPLFGILEQDLDGDDPLYVTVEDIVPHCIAGIRSVQPEGPYILGGLCFGAIVSLEVARALQAQGEDVALIVMIDSYAPGVPIFASEQPAENSSKRIFQQSPGVLFDKVKRKAWRKSWKYIHAVYKKIGRPMPLRFRDIEEANTIANDQYVANEYDGDAVLFQVVSPHERVIMDDSMMGWRDYIHGSVELYQVSGGHLSVYDEPYVQALSEHIRVCIDSFD